jgi:DNA mismatch endonuclease (patch repair protein)
MSRDPAVTSKIMRGVKSRDTRPELALRHELHRRGLRYRLRVPLPGKPDLVFLGARIALFVDGDYWHGNAWRDRGFDSFEAYYGRGDNGTFWLDKIGRNVDRDAAVTRELTRCGWQVLRLWESDIDRNLPGVATEVVAAVRLNQATGNVA